ncbi:MAG: sulfotransferase, partial [Gammaproteobacteria bacterium]|nr:sulfotransferase [Gammaproteobacteria bacterium]
FVLGVPRSGTTFLHRVLADTGDFTTFRLWECLFAPSISQRVFWRMLARLDKLIGGPMARVLHWLESHLFASLDDIHVTRLNDAEEDYLALLPWMAAFILILPFPRSELAWQLATADRDMPEQTRKNLMAFYYALIQKHLYFYGTDRRFLSKNAAFAGLAKSLADTFPDARFLVCLREPEAALPSQLSSIREGILLFQAKRAECFYGERFLDIFPYFYANLHEAMTKRASARHVFLTMADLQKSLDSCLPDALRRLAVPLTPRLQNAIAEQAEAARRYRSSHRVSSDVLSGFGEQDLIAHFSFVVSPWPGLGKKYKPESKPAEAASC